jgi:hypothetical protein
MNNEFQIGDKVYIYRKIKGSWQARLVLCEVIKFYLNKKNILIYSLEDTEGKKYREEELGCLKASEKDDFVKFIK